MPSARTFKARPRGPDGGAAAREGPARHLGCAIPMYAGDTDCINGRRRAGVLHRRQRLAAAVRRARRLKLVVADSCGRPAVDLTRTARPHPRPDRRPHPPHHPDLRTPGCPRPRRPCLHRGLPWVTTPFGRLTGSTSTDSPLPLRNRIRRSAPGRSSVPGALPFTASGPHDQTSRPSTTEQIGQSPAPILVSISATESKWSANDAYSPVTVGAPTNHLPIRPSLASMNCPIQPS